MKGPNRLFQGFPYGYGGCQLEGRSCGCVKLTQGATRPTAWTHLTTPGCDILVQPSQFGRREGLGIMKLQLLLQFRSKEVAPWARSFIKDTHPEEMPRFRRSWQTLHLFQ